MGDIHTHSCIITGTNRGIHAYIHTCIHTYRQGNCGMGRHPYTYAERGAY